MSAILNIQSYDNNINVNYKTDLQSPKAGSPISGGSPAISCDAFTMCQIVNKNETAKALGLNFRELTYSLAAWKSFCLANNLQLTAYYDNGSVVVVQPYVANYYANNAYYNSSAIGVTIL